MNQSFIEFKTDEQSNFVSIEFLFPINKGDVKPFNENKSKLTVPIFKEIITSAIEQKLKSLEETLLKIITAKDRTIVRKPSKKITTTYRVYSNELNLLYDDAEKIELEKMLIAINEIESDNIDNFINDTRFAFEFTPKLLIILSTIKDEKLKFLRNEYYEEVIEALIKNL